jgi:ATP-grasp in the biosynthetic pathway with Ter operon
MIRATTVWFNKGFSSTYNIITSIRAADPGASLRLVSSHTHRALAAFTVSDVSEVEPAGLSGNDYLEYCLDFCRRHEVDVLVPGKSAAFLTENAPAFAALGVRLLVAATGANLRILDHKGDVYASVRHVVAVPEYRVVETREEFDAAWDYLSARYKTVCFKPARSVFGLGFRILTEEGDDLSRLLKGDAVMLSLAQARRLLAERESFPDLLVMPYMEGPERSIDCLGHEGELVRCVVRLKPRGTNIGQLLEHNPAVEETARTLTRHFALSGVYNIQLRDMQGVPHLLEINGRMSGGLHFAHFSGLSFPYWAIQLLLGRCQPRDVPVPRTGLRVGEVSVGIVLPEDGSESRGSRGGEEAGA